MSELKPCPFCGGEAKVRVWGDGLGVTVECQLCYTHKHRDTEAEAIEVWNRRANDVSSD